MKVKPVKPPREFVVGSKEHPITIKDCARIELSADEQVTFVTENGGEYDVARKFWGFYAAPSLNGRLLSFNLRPVLVENRVGRFFILLVEKGKEDLFQEYLDCEHLQVTLWFDDARSLKKLGQRKEKAKKKILKPQKRME